MKKILLLSLALFSLLRVAAANYYVDAAKGKDSNNGRSPQTAFRTLEPLQKVAFAAGDSILLTGGQRHKGMLVLESVSGTANRPIVVASRGRVKATVDGRGEPNGILVSNCNHVVVEKLHVTANCGGLPAGVKVDGRTGVLVTANRNGLFSDITVRKVDVDSVYYEEPGFSRDSQETNSPDGHGKYGWGIRVKYTGEGTQPQLDGITIADCTVTATDHTGIRFTGDKGRQISNIRMTGNKVTYVGGPGLQGSYIRDVYIGNNTVDHSGSVTDSRNWKRGSGLWVWGADNVLVEHNSFTNANGPADSAGAHIDFGCFNVIYQYNFSAHNAGGFCEILGNDYNCAYRYNVSVNDGYRVAGENGARQEGKYFWLSGFIGSKTRRFGPFNSYFYNNTIYVKSEIQAKVSIANTSAGAMLVNNIFYIEGDAVTVHDDQNKTETKDAVARNINIRNNIFLHKGSWPTDNEAQDIQPIFGDPKFVKAGGMKITDYIPSNRELVNRGILIPLIPGDSIGLALGLRVDRDILGRPIKGNPTIGAIQVE